MSFIPIRKKTKATETKETFKKSNKTIHGQIWIKLNV